MKRKILFLLPGLLLSLHSFSQAPKGIQFIAAPDITALQQQARQTYRFLFVECLDKQAKVPARLRAAHEDSATGAFYNTRFLAIQLQLDTSLSFFSQVKALVPARDTALLPPGYPCFLYFSPDGQLVHIGKGIKNANDLLLLGNQAINPALQYVSLLTRYQAGIKEYSLMPQLAVQAKNLGHNATARAVATDYKQHYIDKLPLAEMARPATMDFIGQFPELLQSGDRLFDLFLHHADLVDKETYAGFSKNAAGYVITREYIDPATTGTQQPDWQKIYTTISHRYGESYASHTVTPAQLRYYRKTMQWNAFADTRNTYLEKNPPKPGSSFGSDAWMLNSEAWDLFLYCTDTSALQKALAWSKLSLELDPNNPQFMDTQANLLYKLGRKAAAIKQEELAIQAGIISAHKRGEERGDFFTEYSALLEKMKAGIPTW